MIHCVISIFGQDSRTGKFDAFVLVSSCCRGKVPLYRGTEVELEQIVVIPHDHPMCFALPLISRPSCVLHAQT